ncbi:MAG: nitronate monooxygenase [Thermodesulfobacteriota bacterium]|nr:nitronate monooxygenase [Thermodesulfobacteriota bacterium]
MKRNRVCELLGIRYPILQAPMNWVSGADLTAAVSNAGGLGTLGPNTGVDSIIEDVEITGERIRDQIKKVKNLTENPFAVNIAVGFGELRKFSQKVVEVVIEEEVPVAVVSVGSPDVYTKVLKDAGIKVLHAVSTASHAKKAEKTGVNGVICEGFEAGGHKGLTELTTFTLTPMVADAVTIPVIAGGGIGDARGILAALVLGADGVYMGTRFMLTKESESHQLVKELVVKGGDTCTITLPKGPMIVRDFINSFTKKFMGLKESGISDEDLFQFSLGAQYNAQHLGKAEDGEICCGQVAGLIDGIEKTEYVIDSVKKNIIQLFNDIQKKIECFL